MTPEAGKLPADLAAAAAGPSAPAPAPALAAPSAVRDWKREAADIVSVIASLRHAFPSLGAIYTPQTCDELANAWAPILERHDVDLGRFMIYFTAAGVTVPVAVATGRAIKGDIAAAKVGRPAAPAAADPLAGVEVAQPADYAGAGLKPRADPDLPEKPNVPLPASGPVADSAPPIQ